MDVKPGLGPVPDFKLLFPGIQEELQRDERKRMALEREFEIDEALENEEELFQVTQSSLPCDLLIGGSKTSWVVKTKLWRTCSGNWKIQQWHTKVSI